MGGLYDHSQVLVELIQKHNLGIMAEIGVWKGKTARYILRSQIPSLKTYWGIDQYKPLEQKHGHMSLLSSEDWDGKYLRECLDMYYFDKFRIIRAPSVDAVKVFPDEYFDLVFIDGSHFYNDVWTDMVAWYPKVKIGGFFTGHDYGNRHQEVKPAVDKFLGDDKTITQLGFVWIHEKKTPRTPNSQ